MKKSLYIITLFFCILTYSQAPLADELVSIHSVTEAQMNGILNPIEGSLVYNTNNKLLYQYTGSSWVKITSEGNETKINSTGNTSTTGSGTITDPYIVSSPKPTFTNNPDGSYTFYNGVDSNVEFTPITPANSPILISAIPKVGICKLLGLNETRDVIIEGHYFNGSSTVSIQGQTINSITIDSPTQITVNVTTGSSPGSFNVTATNNVGTNTLNGGFTLLSPTTPVTTSINVSEMTLDGNITYDGNNLTKTGSSGWNDQGYCLTYPISAKGGKLDFSPNQTNRNIMVGLAYKPELSTSYNTLSFGFYVRSNSEIQIREDGIDMNYSTTYSAGDTLSIHVDCIGKVTYYKNGTLIYSSFKKANGDLYFDSSFYTTNGAISNIALTY